MLIIRDEQLKVLGDGMLRSFAISFAQRVQARFPNLVAGMTHDAVVERVLAATVRARRHGVKRKRQLEQFIELEFLYGPVFEARHAEPGRILARTDIDGRRKMAMIENWELFERPPQSPPGTGG